MDIGWRTYDNDNKLTNDNESIDPDQESFYTKSSIEFPTIKHGFKTGVKTEFVRTNGCLSDQWKDDILTARRMLR